MPCRAEQVNGSHALAAADSPKSELPTSKKRIAATLESPRRGKQRRVSEVEAQVEPPSVLHDSTPEIRKSRRSKPVPTPPALPVKDDEDEQATPRCKKVQGKKVATEVVAEEVAITASPKKITKTEATVMKKEEEVELIDSPRGPWKSKKEETTVLVEEKEIEVADSPKKSRNAKKTKVTALLKEEDEEAAGDAPKKVKRHRKTKEEKEAETMPLAARTSGLKMFIGAHVSAAKGEPHACSSQSRYGSTKLG